MPSLYLPADHTDADLILAGQIAEQLQSHELYVMWTPAAGQAAPEVVALMREPVSPWAAAIGLLVRAVARLWVALTPGRAADTPLLAPQASPGSEPAQPRPAAGETAA